MWELDPFSEPIAALLPAQESDAKLAQLGANGYCGALGDDLLALMSGQV